VIGQLYALAALPTERDLAYTLDRRLGGHQSRSGRGSEEKKNTLFAPPENRTPVVQPRA